MRLKLLIKMVMLFASFQLSIEFAKASVVLSQTERLKIISVYSRLTGVVPNKAKIEFYGEIYKTQGAEKLAESISNTEPEFLDVTVKNFVTPFTNQGSDHTAVLSDMGATMIGVVRDNIPFNQIFYLDILYVFRGQIISTTKRSELVSLLDNSGSRMVVTSYFPTGNNFSQFTWQSPSNSDAGVRADFLLTAFPANDSILVHNNKDPNLKHIISKYSYDRNNHYEDADKQFLSFLTPDFIRVKQSDYLHSDERAIAGIMSTREFGRSYLNAGTNRAAISYMMEHFMCKTMFQLKDGTISDQFITKDIPRVPGGKESTYKNDCMTCHTGLDPLTNAFAYHDYDGNSIVYTYNTPAQKINRINSNDDSNIGHYVSDDYWINFWKQGLNAGMNWGPQTDGYGIKKLGEMFAATEAFPKCMATKVVEKICFNNNQKISPSQAPIIESLSSRFITNNYNMRKLFIDSSLRCEELYE